MIDLRGAIRLSTITVAIHVLAVVIFSGVAVVPDPSGGLVDWIIVSVVLSNPITLFEVLFGGGPDTLLVWAVFSVSYIVSLGIVYASLRYSGIRPKQIVAGGGST